MTFPDGFLWGASTAAHQIEGGNVNSDWWQREWGHLPGPGVEEPSGDAADSYHRYPEDMRLLAAAGLGAYRFSIEWARIEPEDGWVSRAAIEHYRRMVGTARESGLEPVITLHHFTNPIWFARRGGWHEDDAPERFARFVEAARPVLDGVDLVCTINEPNMVSVLADPEVGFPSIGLPPGVPAVTDRLIDAHRRAVEIVRSAGGRAGWSVATQAYQPEPGADEVAAEYGRSREDVFLDAAAGDDWVGVQAYTRTRIGEGGPLPIPEDAERTLTGWEYYPDAVGYGIRNAWARAGVPVYVTENGIATDDDTRRISYTQGALAAVESCLRDGVDVRGYLHWSALDNYEWGSFRPTFGLIGWDRDTFVRRPKPSLAWLGSVARANALG
ncbi:glycoside hydrolase family 1 protein [Microbacterium terricola]|uniref:beta-glucosidase n=1 Tax=Microbacterium terricola TaxID=344163 RepID=A0ABM8E147_9MICO|nr:family 1 glycosylhydrolase [Microbacterium terricola]UYK40738.1 family 1 glycosylhydrolase [Microbacterium terricola]BDV31525.1 beta-glucosidase [Microbacterium terricola]